MTGKSHAMHLMVLEITEKHGITEMYNDMDTETRKHFFQFIKSINTTIDTWEIVLVAYIVGYDRGCNSPPSTQFGT